MEFLKSIKRQSKMYSVAQTGVGAASGRRMEMSA